jgi:hypothetical protein
MPMPILVGCLRTVSLLLGVGALVSLMGALSFPMLDSSLNMDFPKWVDNTDKVLPDLHLRGKITEWVVKEAGISVGTVHLAGIISDLWFREGEYLLALIILVFSIMFPLVKIVLTLYLSASGLFEKMNAEVAQRQKMTHMFLKLTSKWSMTDVFIVALTVVFFKAKGVHFMITPKKGFYFFMCAAFASSIAVQMLDMATERDLEKDNYSRVYESSDSSTEALRPRPGREEEKYPPDSNGVC